MRAGGLVRAGGMRRPGRVRTSGLLRLGLPAGGLWASRLLRAGGMRRAGRVRAGRAERGRRRVRAGRPLRRERPGARRLRRDAGAGLVQRWAGGWRHRTGGGKRTEPGWRLVVLVLLRLVRHSPGGYRLCRATVLGGMPDRRICVRSTFLGGTVVRCRSGRVLLSARRRGAVGAHLASSTATGPSRPTLRSASWTDAAASRYPAESSGPACRGAHDDAPTIGCRDGGDA